MKFLFYSEENLELMEDLNVVDLIVDAIKMHKKVCWNLKSLKIELYHNSPVVTSLVSRYRSHNTGFMLQEA